MLDNWCGREQFEFNMAETKARRAREAALKANPLVFTDYADVLALARKGSLEAIAELRRRDAIKH